MFWLLLAVAVVVDTSAAVVARADCLTFLHNLLQSIITRSQSEAVVRVAPI
jgi:hypothetical protein